MKTRVSTALADGEVISAGNRIAAELEAGLHGEPPVLILAFASTRQPVEGVSGILQRSFPGATVLICSSAGEFTQRGDAKGSVSAFAVAGDFRVSAGVGLGLGADPRRAVSAALDGQPEKVSGYEHCTALMLLDPLSGKGEEATLVAAALLGDDVQLAGGAAGDDLEMRQTQVGVNSKVVSDAVVIAKLFSRQPLALGASHGHQVFSAPMTVTRASGGVVFEVDGRPAWDVWVEATRADMKKSGMDATKLTEAETGAFLLRYEAGLLTGDAPKIRAPLARNPDGSLLFACGIPVGAKFKITKSSSEAQVQSARRAASRARTLLGNRPAAGALVFDCICRNVILGKDFDRAVRGISEELGRVPIAGFETYGEIALGAGDMSGFHNTSTVVLAFPG